MLDVGCIVKISPLSVEVCCVKLHLSMLAFAAQARSGPLLYLITLGNLLSLMPPAGRYLSRLRAVNIETPSIRSLQSSMLPQETVQVFVDVVSLISLGLRCLL